MARTIDTVEAREACALARRQACAVLVALVRAGAQITRLAMPARVARARAIGLAAAVPRAVMRARARRTVDAAPASRALAASRRSAHAMARAVVRARWRHGDRARGAPPARFAGARAPSHVAPATKGSIALEASNARACGPLAQRSAPPLLTLARTRTLVTPPMSGAVGRAGPHRTIGAAPRRLAAAFARAPIACAVASTLDRHARSGVRRGVRGQRCGACEALAEGSSTTVWADALGEASVDARAAAVVHAAHHETTDDAEPAAAHVGGRERTQGDRHAMANARAAWAACTAHKFTPLACEARVTGTRTAHAQAAAGAVRVGAGEHLAGSPRAAGRAAACPIAARAHTRAMVRAVTHVTARAAPPRKALAPTRQPVAVAIRAAAGAVMALEQPTVRPREANQAAAGARAIVAPAAARAAAAAVATVDELAGLAAPAGAAHALPILARAVPMAVGEACARALRAVAPAVAFGAHALARDAVTATPGGFAPGQALAFRARRTRPSRKALAPAGDARAVAPAARGAAWNAAVDPLEARKALALAAREVAPPVSGALAWTGTRFTDGTDRATFTEADAELASTSARAGEAPVGRAGRRHRAIGAAPPIHARARARRVLAPAMGAAAVCRALAYIACGTCPALCAGALAVVAFAASMAVGEVRARAQRACKPRPPTLTLTRAVVAADAATVACIGALALLTCGATIPTEALARAAGVAQAAARARAQPAAARRPSSRARRRRQAVPASPPVVALASAAADATAAARAFMGAGWLVTECALPATQAGAPRRAALTPAVGAAWVVMPEGRAAVRVPVHLAEGRRARPSQQRDRGVAVVIRRRPPSEEALQQRWRRARAARRRVQH